MRRARAEGAERGGGGAVREPPHVDDVHPVAAQSSEQVLPRAAA